MSIVAPGHGDLTRIELGMSTHLKSRPVRTIVLLAPTALMLSLAAFAAQAGVVVGGKGSPRVPATGAPVSMAGMATTAAAVALVALTAVFVAISGWMSQRHVGEAAAPLCCPANRCNHP